MFSGELPMREAEAEDDNDIPADDENANKQKPDKTIRKKLENYLDDLELKRQLKDDWGDEDKDL
jgi:hypothetical protein